MDMTLTNILLSVLITLVGFIGKSFYDKLEKIEADVRQTLIDSSRMKENIIDHERRINKLENEVNA